MAGGVIFFRSTENPTVTATSVIRADGSFELSTVTGADRLAGAIAGPHRVTVQAPLGDDQSLRQSRLESPILIEAKPSNLAIEIPPPQ